MRIRKAYLQKALSFLDSELELLQSQIKHPEAFGKIGSLQSSLSQPQSFQSQLSRPQLSQPQLSPSQLSDFQLSPSIQLSSPSLSSPSCSPLSSSFSSPFSLISKFPYLGIMGMTEILSALLLLGGIEDPNGNPPTTKALAEAFEQLFDFHFNSIYDCQGELYRRKPCNLTKTLDAMKGALMKEYKRKESGKKY